MSENLSHLKYRPDIDGLRAIAVLSVVIFHAFPGALTGGFVGVDVFFVISGFLISTFIFQNIDRGTFSIGGFYVRRFRRIFPALVLLLLTVFCLGWICLFPEEFQQLGKHLVASGGFRQNFILWKESGYFNTEAETKPLLHNWSLAIEEQFYFIVPLLLWAAGRIGKGRQNKWLYLIATLFIFAISFGLNVNLVQTDQVKTFYLPQYRFWELAAGMALSWLVLYAPNISVTKKYFKEGPAFIGLAGLLYVILTFNKETLFPGKNALVPVAATALIIFSGQESILNKRLLANKVLVWFGLISYPLYLWHWSLLSFARILRGETPPFFSRLLIVAISIALSWITYAFVERRIRHNPSRILLGFVCTIWVAVSFAGQYLKDHSGIKDRAIVRRNLPDTGYDGGDQGNLVEGCGLDPKVIMEFPVGGCRHDKRDTPHIALIGDSKAAAFVDGLVRKSDKDTRVLFIGGTGDRGSVGPYNSINYSRDRDVNLPNPLLGFATAAVLENKDIRTVILYFATRAMFLLNGDNDILDLPESRNFDFAYERTNQLVRQLVSGGKRVVLLVDNPTLPEPTSCLERKLGIGFLDDWSGKEKSSGSRCSISYDKHLELSKQYRNVLAKIQSEHSGNVRIFDTVPLLCDMHTRTCSMTLNGRQLYSFSDHISDYAAGIVAQKLIPFIRSGD